MTYAVVWLVEAQAALDGLYDGLEGLQPGAGKRALRRIRASTLKLAEFPRSGRVVPEADLPALRELIVPPYRLLYRVFDDRVEILTVFHGALDFDLED